ncbi:hypothetical protein ABZ924_03255 [Streptomyces sp. NPDC046876]|uniref:hypothetical protein n=1 Tax=Streptomyces sp. NPDC046876 TaxID=3155616 RepID=UPI0033CE48CF
MHSLGKRLGTVATALHWHVKNKDELVLLAGDRVWDEIGLPDQVAPRRPQPLPLREGRLPGPGRGPGGGRRLHVRARSAPSEPRPPPRRPGGRTATAATPRS